MAVDEAGEDVVVAEVGDFGSGGDGEGPGFDGLDAVTGEDEDDVLAVGAGFAVEEVAGFDVGGLGGGWGLGGGGLVEGYCG